ncbi:DHA2 family efflux MFS transporter permease subunit [Methanogenium sp. S4BF]|uniref:DHA2 family efflux MFS transporter permease subunit n=1 Tax=Methanogenium sp. S4BF TaxID=1789226 RepID=UPI00241713A6|nr:DHA2 family efflux MFS transporter permease subunit [Methanogenium sp. S4BF]WFN35348.1 DHA2 family efflux MFS transporter permease subunit [Methanogenium sp. S4BF]
MKHSQNGDSLGKYGLLIISIALATFMASLDGTIVNIALPTISASFDISSSTVSWVSTAYLLVMAGCVLIFGKISDIIGFKKIFLSGFVVFSLGSFLCGFLPEILDSFYTLVGSRVIQAVGGAMISAIGPAMITAFIPMNLKGKAMGIIMTIAALGTALGPTLGGFLTQYMSWHWIFFINVPVGIIAVILGAKVIPATPSRGNLSGFDRSGAALIFIGLASLLFAVSEGDTLGWTSLPIAGSIVLAIASLGYFILHELKSADPILELSLFKNKNFLLTNLIMSLVFFSFAGINYLLPFYLEYVQGFDTSSAGLILTALSVAMMIAGILAGAIYNKTGGRILCIAAAGSLAVGYFLITKLSADTSVGFIVLCLLIIGFGLGLVITPLSNMIMNSVSRKNQGMVSSLTSLERFAPMTIGIAIFNLIFIQGMSAIAEHRGVTQDAPVTIKMSVLAAGFDLAFFFAFIFAIIILGLTILARQEIHPDYANGDENEEPAMGII